MKIRVTHAITLGPEEIHEDFVRASGPGGQNVNKVSSAVKLRFDVAHSPSLTEDIKKSLSSLAGKRMTPDGVLLITAGRFRTQERNRIDAVQRLVDLVRRASLPKTVRRATTPTPRSRAERLEVKARRGSVKRARRPPTEID